MTNPIANVASKDEDTPPQLLRRAAMAIEAALARLNVRRYQPTASEQRGRFMNFAHAKTFMRFTDLPRRLRKEADHLDAKDRHAPHGAIEETTCDQEN